MFYYPCPIFLRAAFFTNIPGLHLAVRTLCISLKSALTFVNPSQQLVSSALAVDGKLTRGTGGLSVDFS